MKGIKFRKYTKKETISKSLFDGEVPDKKCFPDIVLPRKDKIYLVNSRTGEVLKEFKDDEIVGGYEYIDFKGNKVVKNYTAKEELNHRYVTFMDMTYDKKRKVSFSTYNPGDFERYVEKYGKE